MSGAAIAFQTALVAALAAHPPLADALAGIFDGPPPRSPYPYLAIGPIAASDWSHKSGRGRELRLTLSLWDDGATPARLHGLLAEAERAIDALPRDLGGHDLVSLAFLGSRVLRDPAGPWAGILDYRARTLEQ